MKFITIILMMLLLTIGSAIANEGAVVEINSFLPSGSIKQGTGFFFRDNASILTAYHVIRNAKKIIVITKEGQGGYPAKVVFVSGKHDVAMLYIPVLKESPAHINLAPAGFIPPITETLHVIGYPRGSGQHYIRSYITSKTYIKSKTIKARSGLTPFLENIDVLPLDLTNYVGMSGAPVISSSGLIGLFSGSYDEGGAIGWVIPRKFFYKLEKIDKFPDKILSWPRLTLMDPSFRDLRRSFDIGSKGSQLITTYMDDVEELSRLYDHMTTISAKAGASAKVLVYLIPNESTGRTVDLEVLDIPLRLLLENMKDYGTTHTEMGEVKLKIGRHLMDVTYWFINESTISKTGGKYLDKRINEINKTYADTAKGYYAAVGATDEENKQMLLLAQSFYSEKDDRKRIRALRQFATFVENSTSKYHSITAVDFIARDIGKYRSAGKLFFESLQNLK